MDTHPPQPGPSGSKSSRLAGALSYTSLIGTQQERRHQLFHCDAVNAVTKNMTQDAHLKIVRKTGSSMNEMQHAVGFEFIHTVVNRHQFTVYHTAGVRRELHDEFVTVCNGKSPWSTKAFIPTVREIKHHDGVSSGIFAN